MPTATEDGSSARSAAAPPGKTLPPHLQKAVARVTEISSLPEITTRIVQVVEDPRATATDMHDIVKNDPALATKILKVVNSAFYGLPSQIASLDRAIIMLGLSAVKNIALAASLARLFQGGAISERFAAADLWRHCISVGVSARLIAQRQRSAHADEYFVAGLVHDMGLLVASQVMPDKFRAVADRCLYQPQNYCAVEVELIGADHQEFGVALATKWKFPPALRYATAYHHDPSSLQPEHRRIVALVQVADTLSCQMQHGFFLTAQHQQLTDELLDLIGIGAASLEEIRAEVPTRIAEAEQILSPS